LELNSKTNIKILRMNTVKEPDVVYFKVNLHDVSAEEEEY